MLMNGNTATKSTIPLLREAPEPFRYEKEEKDGRLFLRGILQKSATLNQNKRIYPHDILFREVNNYQKLIEERRSLGEADHPDCIRKGAKILTKSGWKKFEDISDREWVVTVNRDTNKLEVQQISGKIDQVYRGGMYRFKNMHIDTMVTPNHRFWVIDRYGNGSFATAQEIYENRKRFDKSYIPRRFEWDGSPEHQGENPVAFTLPGIPKDRWEKLPHADRDRFAQPLKLDATDFCSFMGIYLSEGSHSKSGGNSNSIYVYQNEGDVANEIRGLLDRMGVMWSETYTANEHSGKTRVTFHVRDARLQEFLDPLGCAWEKYVPQKVKELPGNVLQHLLDWYHMGDGRTRHCEFGVAKEVFSTSRRLIEDLQELQIKAGASGNIHTRIPVDRKIEDRIILAENSRPLHILHFSNNRGMYLTERCMSIEKVDYDDRVYCVTVPNETFFVMDEGKVYLSGNSSVVELKNASHLITKTWWEGNELWGQVEVLDTHHGKTIKALVNADVTLGISSRGVGSTAHINGIDVVQDDFMLICWDFVSEPSTPGAFMFKEGVEVPRALVEGKFFNESDMIYREANRLRAIYDRIRSEEA